jgi:V/A-type H+-transporting ATPase subunit E
MTQQRKRHEHVAFGVEGLIERLRYEGVESGRREAERIIEEAQRRANDIIDRAELDADRIRQDAQKAAEHLKVSAQEALAVAARDTLITLKTQLTNRFAQEVKRLVSEQMHSAELLRQLILEVTGQAAKQIVQDERMKLLLPHDVVGLESLRRDPEELAGGELTRFVQALSEECFRKGVTFGEMEGKRGGLTIHLEDRAMTIDLTDEAVADLLLEHLQPRFRALLEGIVR